MSGKPTPPSSNPTPAGASVSASRSHPHPNAAMPYPAMSYPPPPNGPPPPPPPPNLPPYWTTHYDPHGRPYYLNTLDNSTHWTPPPESNPPPPPPPGGPPPGNYGAYPDPHAPPAHLQHHPSQGYPPQPYAQQQSSYQPQPSYPHPPFQPNPQHQQSYAQPPHFPPQPPQQSHVSQVKQPHRPPTQQQHDPSNLPPMPGQPQPYPSNDPSTNLSAPPGYPMHQPSSTVPPQASYSQPPPMQQPTQMTNVSALLGGMQTVSIGPGGQASGSYISLEFRAVGLKDKDIIGRSDPICYVYVPDEPPNLAVASSPAQVAKWKAVGKTEILQNTTSPNWATRVKVPYYFERHQPLRFVLIDVDNMQKPMAGDKLGQCTVTLAEIVRNGILTLKLTNTPKGKASVSTKSMGDLIVRAHDEAKPGKVRVHLALGAKNLDKMDTFGQSDPYYVLKHVVGTGASGTSTLYQSEEIKSDRNPTWKPHTVYIPTGGVTWENVQLQLAVYDWDRFTPHDLIGDVNMSLAELSRRPSFDVINRKKAAKKARYKNSGQVVVHRADAVELPGFVSYIQGGLRLNFIVAVDFTASNRPPTHPDSLHYNGDPGRPSQYAQALSAIGTTLLGYIPDGQMTALGFGANLPGQGSVTSFDFALTGQPDPRVQGVEGLLAAYQQAVQNVTFAGPTNFTPLIRNAMGICSATPVSQAQQHFSVLLILTDGIITDLSSTIDTIIEASFSTPIAIVIVGIGNANFSSMERLDADNHVLRSDKTGRHAKHDIVQFTQFTQGMSIQDFARDVLHEVPKRVVEYMVDAGIKPNAPAY